MTSYIIASIGFALCLYGLTPLSGSRPLEPFISERGAFAFCIGVAVLAFVGIVKVAS